MYKYESVRNAIKELGGGEYQALAQQYVLKKYGLSAPNYLGMCPGTTKTAKGTPDAFYKDSNGEYVFVEVGHSSGMSSEVERKIRDDINKCIMVEQKSTGNYKVARIICCHASSRLEPDAAGRLEGIDPRVLLIGPDEIAADISTKYFFLAEEYLGLPYPNNVILDVEKFIALNEADDCCPTLLKELRGRGNDLKALEDLLSDHRVVMVSGKSGCGKTRIALEAAKRYSKSINADLYIIRPAMQRTLFQELDEYFSDDEQYVLVVDDVNQLIDLESLVDHCLSHENIHLVLTVRNYAAKQSQDQMGRIRSFCSYTLECLSGETIGSILESDFSIRNEVYRDQILRVAKGNLRLAILAAVKARDGFKNILNCGDLLNVCYGDAIKKMDNAEIVACEIAALLGPHATEGNDDLAKLENRLSISHDMYLRSCASACAKELMDMVQDYAAVAFEEQNLRDFFIYRCIIEERTVFISELWCLKKGRQITARVLNTLFNVFNDEVLWKFARKEALSIWDSLEAAGKYEAIDTLRFLLETEVLLFLREEMSQLVPCHVAYSLEEAEKNRGNGSIISRILNGLCDCLDGDLYQESLNLIFGYFDTDCSPAEDFYSIFTGKLRPSYAQMGVDYRIPEAVVSKFEDRANRGLTKNGALLLYLFVKSLLHDEFSDTRPGEGNTIVFVSGTLPFSDELIELRSRALDCLGLASDELLQKALRGYQPRSLEGSDLSRGTYDLVEARLNLSGAQTLNDYCELRHLWQSMQRTGFNSEKISEFFSHSWASRAIQMFLSRDFAYQGDEKDGFKALEGMTADSFSELIDIVSGYTPKPGVNDWPVRVGLESLFKALRSTDSELFSFAVNRYLRSGLPPDRIDGIIAARFFDVDEDPTKGRSLLLSTPGVKVGLWASAYDYYCLMNKGLIPDVDLVLKSVVEDGERLRHETVLKTEGLAPGFYTSYLKAVLSAGQDGALSLVHFFPYSETQGDYDDFAKLLVDEVILQTVEASLLQTVRCCGSHVPKAAVSLILDRDEEFVLKLILPVLQADAGESWHEEISQSIWGSADAVKLIIRIASLLDKSMEQINLFGAYGFMGQIFADAEKMEKLDESVGCLMNALQVMPDSPILRYVQRFLSSDGKVLYATKLAQKDAAWTEIVDVVAGSERFGASWSGSYLNVINRQRKLMKDARKRFHELGIEGYDLDFLSLEKSYDRQAAKTEIEDFLDPYI